MKKLIATMFIAASIASAGVVKVATYPVRHPWKSTKASFHAAKKTVKAVAKGAYNL